MEKRNNLEYLIPAMASIDEIARELNKKENLYIVAYEKVNEKTLIVDDLSDGEHIQQVRLINL